MTDSIFDSLKFSKQVTKRSLRENIRESLEKMESVIFVKLLEVKIEKYLADSIIQNAKCLVFG